MNNAIEIQKDIWWIGVNDRRTHIFENYWPLPKGVAYNSYVIVDEKIVVVDTVERSRMDDYLESLEAVIGNRQVDYLIINHMEPDHTGAIKALLCHYPNLDKPSETVKLFRCWKISMECITTCWK